MADKKTKTQEIFSTLDKIFLLNHSIMTDMINASFDEEISRIPKLNQSLEDQKFEQLGSYFQTLRKQIRECLKLGKEIIERDYSGLSQEAIDEMVLQESAEYIESLQKSLEDEIDGLFMAMNFVPMGDPKEADKVTADYTSVYKGKPEEFVRAQEYRSLMESVVTQLDIIEFEDEIRKSSDESGLVFSPSIVPFLVDALANERAFKVGEEQCEKYVAESRTQEEVFDEFPELRDTMEQVEYLRIQNRYKRRFEEQTGYLCPKAAYSQYFRTLYNYGALPLKTGFSAQEIDDRISSRVKTYSETNKDVINSMFKSSVKKFRKVRAKRKMKELTQMAKLRVSTLASATGRLFTKSDEYAEKLQIQRKEARRKKKVDKRKKERQEAVPRKKYDGNREDR